jgi:hypothetical protein
LVLQLFSSGFHANDPVQPARLNRRRELCAMSVVKDLLRMQGISPEPSKNTQPSIIDLRSWPRSYLTK